MDRVKDRTDWLDPKDDDAGSTGTSQVEVQVSLYFAVLHDSYVC